MKNMSSKSFLLLTLPLLMFSGCNSGNSKIDSSLESITKESLKSNISIIASDEFQGRAPSSAGEEKTINFLAEQFKQLGLKPANGESYFQEVSLMKIYSDKSMNFTISDGKNKSALIFSQDYVGGTPQINDLIKFDNSEMVFIGYGINSPEFNWNDYQGLDVKGKTVVMLVNDPGYATSDSTLFDGKSMTYYGRWTYKFEEAARQGATAAIIIHETGAAAYPWGVVQNSWSGSKLYLTENMLTKSPLQFQSWITTECAKRLFENAGLNYEETIASASKRGFKAIDLKLKASASIKNRLEYVKSNNVAAILPGGAKADEVVIYTAHWDHFGINPAFKGDSILNGAADNATGVAALLELAKAFTKLKKVQDRSVMFLSVTCEEQGLLGSEYYVEHPLIPLEKTTGVINMDMLNIFGRTKDMIITGLGKSGLDDYVVSVLKKYGRYVTGDPTPEKGHYFRSDHLSFAKAGVKALYLSKGVDNIEHGREWGIRQIDNWVTENYHKPSDNYDPQTWNFEGMLEDMKVYFEVGYRIANSK